MEDEINTLNVKPDSTEQIALSLIEINNRLVQANYKLITENFLTVIISLISVSINFGFILKYIFGANL